MIETPATSVQKRRVAIALTLLLTLVALTLRFYRLSNQSLWTDEVSSIETAREPLSQMTRDSGSENVYLPGYFLLLGAVLSDANQNIEFRARGLSALAGGLSVPLLIGVVYCWRRQWGTALLAGLLLAVNPLHLWYSQEVRAYATMLFFGLLTLLAYELARASRKPWWWVVYFLSALGAIALHKTAIIFPMACALWHGWEVWREKGRLRDLAVHVATLGVVCGALLLRSYPPPPENGRSRSLLELPYTFMTFVGGYSFGPSITHIQSHGALRAVSRNLLQVGILGGVLSLLTLAYALKFRSLVRGKETSLVILNLGFVSLATLICSFPFNVRYTLPALLAFVALVAALNSGAGSRYVARLTITAVLLLGLWADAQWFYSPAYRKADSRAVAQWLVANQARVKSWTVLPGYLSLSIEWYLQGHPEILARKQPPAQPHTTSFPPVPDVLIIGRRHHITEPDRIIAAYRASAKAVRTIAAITGFELYVREVAPPGTGVPEFGAGASAAPGAPR
ncbi:MAG: phospholipid carrier-dependent glycosyltransferase [Limisphaerales bacterium]